MKKKKTIVFSIIFLYYAVSFAQFDSINGATIMVDILRVYPVSNAKNTLVDMIVKKPTGDSINLYRDTASSDADIVRANLVEGKYKWTLNLVKPQIVRNNGIPGLIYLTKPGDSILICCNGDACRFEGKGATKYEAMYEINKVKNSFPEPFRYIGRWISVSEYLVLNQYFDKQIDRIVSVLESFKNKLSQADYNWIKAYNIYLIEQTRLLAFSFIPVQDKIIKRDKFTHSPEGLVKVWDTTMYKPWGKWIRSQNFEETTLDYSEGFNATEFLREHSFNESSDTLMNIAISKKLIYNKIKNNPNYKGVYRERLMSFYLDEEITQELGAYNPMAQAILKDYYSQPGFAVYKNWVKSLEKSRQYLYEKNSDAPLFELNDKKGNKFVFNDIKDKFAIVNFWCAGCENCKQNTIRVTNLYK